MAGAIISAVELQAAWRAGVSPVLLDVRWALVGPSGLPEYRRGHLPGARYVDLDRDLASHPGDGRGRHALPTAAEFEAAMRRVGVDDADPIVVYDAGPGLSASRAWWLLRHFGHADARLLDGGLAAAVAAGLPLTREEASTAPGSFTATDGGMGVLDAAAAARVARTGLLLDARAAERYRGEVEPVDPVAGHIPGARSAPTTANVTSEGRFLRAVELRSRFTALGAGNGVEVGVYCGSGVTAAHEVLALELAGIPAALYAGSWSEWVSDPSRPVATGPQPGVPR